MHSYVANISAQDPTTPSSPYGFRLRYAPHKNFRAMLNNDLPQAGSEGDRTDSHYSRWSESP